MLWCGGKERWRHIDTITANYTVLASGGIGGIYRYSTNYRHLTGDAIALALKHGIELKNTNYVQIHPTTFYTENETDRSFLISESVRGEGAVLLDKKMERIYRWTATKRRCYQRNKKTNEKGRNWFCVAVYETNWQRTVRKPFSKYSKTL